jgi:hypothetical protein
MSFLVDRKAIGSRDFWLESRLAWLSLEVRRLGGGMTSRYHLNQAVIWYMEYLATGQMRRRFRAWEQLFACSVWLAQLERKN